jgi:hypothetical protein
MDSKAAIDLTADPVAFKKTKHILRHAHELRDRVARRIFKPGLSASLLQARQSWSLMRLLRSLLQWLPLRYAQAMPPSLPSSPIEGMPGAPAHPMPANALWQRMQALIHHAPTQSPSVPTADQPSLLSTSPPISAGSSPFDLPDLPTMRGPDEPPQTCDIQMYLHIPFPMPATPAGAASVDQPASAGPSHGPYLNPSHITADTLAPTTTLVHGPIPLGTSASDTECPHTKRARCHTCAGYYCRSCERADLWSPPCICRQPSTWEDPTLRSLLFCDD